MKKILHAFDIKYVLLLTVLSAVMICGFTQYVTPLEKAKQAAIEQLETYSVKPYLYEDRPDVKDFLKSYEEPIRNCINVAEVDEQMQSMEKAVSRKFKRKGQVIKSYDKRLERRIKRIYSKADRKAARSFVAEFDNRAKKCRKREDIELAFITAKQRISTFKTIKQHKQEVAEREYLYGSWQLPGTDEYPFALNESGSFYMPIEQKTTSYKRIFRNHRFRRKKVVTTEDGNIGGSWTLTEDKQVIINITYNTLDPDYEPYTWIFNYNTKDKTLEGTGDYYGWNYTKIG